MFCKPALYSGFPATSEILLNRSSQQVKPSSHQFPVMPSLTGWTTTTGTSCSLSSKCFSSCILYTNAWMYRKCIYRVVPCSDDPVVSFTKGSSVCKHNRCCFDLDGGLWDWPMTKSSISIERSSQGSVFVSTSMTAIWLDLPPAPCIIEKTLSHRHLPFCLSINNEYAKTILCIWPLIFIL